MCHGPDAAGKPAMKSPSIKGKTADEIQKEISTSPKHASLKDPDCGPGERTRRLSGHLEVAANFARDGFTAVGWRRALPGINVTRVCLAESSRWAGTGCCLRWEDLYGDVRPS